ncbi:MAG: DUF917 domain-containing protein [Thermomicrobiales bacterium]
MAASVLTKEDLWDLVVGGSAIATGGGGTGPTREQFDAYVDPILESGAQPSLLDPGELDDDAMVYMEVGAGGGVTRADRERYLSPGIAGWWRRDINRTQWIRDRLDEYDNLYPVGSWAEPPDEGWNEQIDQRMAELHGAEPDAHLIFEIGPNVFRSMLAAAQKGNPLIDADIAGYRAVPEVSLCSFNIHGVPAQPVLFASAWGDVIVLERVISWQRMEDIGRHLAVVSGGGVRGLMAFDGETVREKTFSGTVSKALEVGRAIRAARESGRDVAQAVADITDGHVLFRGTVLARLNEDHTAFIWGTERILGTGEWKGQTFKIWYKNENHMSWIDDAPFVMSPDLITVIDPETGYGLSNFDSPAWDYGREVAVLGAPCHPLWRSERGLRIFHPARWGFACDYTPIDEAVAKVQGGSG